MVADNDILKIFYEQIIPVASSTGVVEVDGIKYHIAFNTIINNRETKVTDSTLPMLTINDVDEFNRLLIKHIKSNIKIFDDNRFDRIKEMVCGNKKEDQIKYLLVMLFSNAREDDFKNPINYLNMQLDFIENTQLVDKYSEYTTISNIDKLDDSSIQIMSTRQNPFMETPYVFSSRICKEIDGNIESFNLPDISYGITNNSVYIYTIQGKPRSREKESKYEKRINRLLYKINDGISGDFEYMEYRNGDSSYYPENVIDVTHSSVVALSIFLGILQNEGFDNIVVVDYLPIRYTSRTKRILSIVDRKINEGKYDELEKLQKSFLEQDYNQYNMTNKFIRTFRRVDYHLDNMNIIAYPNEIDNSMHIKLRKSNKDSDNLVNIIYNSVHKSNSKER